MIARLAFVAGRVQGVGFRNFAQRQARALGVRGYARNLADGRVEVLALGPEAAVSEFLGCVAKGPAWADVRTVEVLESPVLNCEGFEIR